MATVNNGGDRRFLLLLVASIVFHVLTYFFLSLIRPPAGPAIQGQKTVKVRLTAPETKETSEKLKTEPPPKTEQIKPKEPDPLPELPNSYAADSVEGSTNNVKKVDSVIKHGERAKVKKEKNRSLAKQEESGAISTKTASIAQTKKITENNEEDEKLSEILSNLYGDYEGEDEENSQSIGEADDGVESELEIDPDKVIKRNIEDIGNTKLLADTELSDTFIEDPFSDKKSKEFTIINRYLKAIWDTVIEGWVNPLSEGQIRQEPSVEIMFELNDEGAIRFPKVKVQSKFAQLDASLIKRLEELRHHKFDIHESYLDKYRYFTLRWSGSRDAYELMPFEKE